MITEEADFFLSSYDFELPPEQIAQFPPEERGASRLLVMPRTGDLDLRHARFSDLPGLLPEKALIVVNNSRVLQARLLGSRATGGKVEFLLLTPLPLVLAQAGPDAPAGAEGAFSAEAEGLVRAGGRVREGETFDFGAGIRVTVLQSGPFGRRRVRLRWQGDLAKAFAATGHIPLPPYIKRADGEEDLNRYQTVYARDDKTGSVAAPTAGLHFTPELRRELRQAGFQWAEVTLYVGYGTFSPVRSEDIRGHRMHREYVEIPEATAEAVARARAEKRPVVAVGTTSVRALEGVAELCGRVQPYTGWTDIFLYPGRGFRVVDAVLTNFHLPESSLLMLISAFAGRKRVLAAYAEAVARGYRFFSYGDAMLIR
ncbi:tRNA preQ1(34) S-adenosylmethionine ribosyltransferase-isomerase QueA [Desulfovibrio sp. ZJ369]|uniref:tRNA preQ1(34) S-adenosylmethionine ribosyltransferase-isomerase QueA n=1 Tax=Desulfovibrio sp. ZJ369 TaxID=2709793 RepID=UPI0013EC7552|nr:tRNA preQ1(34) S-adenosylmethionine ribosyltransferase-isomerase QueA [Desulfovibrio sp. ZJ369]